MQVRKDEKSVSLGIFDGDSLHEGSWYDDDIFENGIFENGLLKKGYRIREGVKEHGSFESGVFHQGVSYKTIAFSGLHDEYGLVYGLKDWKDLGMYWRGERILSHGAFIHLTILLRRERIPLPLIVRVQEFLRKA